MARDIMSVAASITSWDLLSVCLAGFLRIGNDA
jgi:hypothetical protein